VEMGYLTVLHVRLGAKIRDLHAKDSHSFCNGPLRLILRLLYISSYSITLLIK
jgi:hypothetical protein